LLLAFIAGVAIRSFTEVPIVILGLGVLVGTIGLSVGISKRDKNIIIGSLLIISFLFGIFRFEEVTKRSPNLSLLYGKPIAARGYIVEEPEVTLRIQRIKFKVQSLEGDKSFTPFFVLITLRRYPQYKIGDELEIRGTLERPINFGEFDYVAYLAREDIYAIFSFPTVEKIGEGRGSKLKIILSEIKHSFEKNLERVLPEPHAAFLKGLTLGERESLPQDLVENFNRIGVTHIIALSGYNITLIGDFFIETLIALTVPFNIAFWIAVAGILLFVLLTGASPSVVRAGIMGMLVLVAQKEGRLYRITNALVFAGAVMIFHNPKILRFDAAFQLSFLATLGLIFLSPHIDEKLKRAWHAFKSGLGFGGGSFVFEKDYNPNLILFPFRKILAETLAAQLAVLPLLIYLFGRVSIVSPFSNLLVILAVPPSMAAGFLTGVLGFIGEPLSQISAIVNWVFLEYKIRIIEFLAKVPWVSVELGKWAAAPLAFFYAIVFLRLWLKSRKI